MTTTIRKETIELPMSRLGPPSNMPRFRWQQPIPDRPTPPNEGLTPEETAHGFNWGEDSILPYQVSDDYDRDLRSGTLDVVAIENGRLRAVVAPSLGGRLIELKDLKSGRDLVFRNPVFQPANLAALNAWFSGGIEWNGLIPGHTPFTCAPVFAGTRETPQGPILRIYEFDRVVEATWQVDLFLPHDADRLFAHGRIVNTSSQPRLAYWWTNIAAPMTTGTRVLSPADYSVEHIWPGNNLGRRQFPDPSLDGSYPDNWENATSVFFRAPDAPRLFIASVDANGVGMVQTSTKEMHGRKFFYFGNAVGGQNWMDHLARPGEGNYLEIQSGIAPTQNQRFELAPGEQRDWTEVFAPIQLDAVKAHATDYQAAVAVAAEALDEIIPAADLASVNAFLRRQARQPLDTRLSAGNAWGLRQESLLGYTLAAGLDFTVDTDDGFWDELSRGYAVSEKNLEQMPLGVALSASWVDRLTASGTRVGMSWLHMLYLATAALDRGDTYAAEEWSSASVLTRPSWAGHRLEALLAARANEPHTATTSYLAAWAMGDAPPELAIEIATHLMTSGRPGELKAFVDALPETVRDRERIIIARAVVAADEGHLDELEHLLMSRQFATIREGETLLSDLWVRLRRGRLEARLGRTAVSAELQADLREHPVPRALDLRMHALDDL